jgi:monoamine oxidase
VLHALFYTKAGVSLTNLVTSEKGAQEQLVREGAQTIANKIQESLGDAVHLDEPVVGVDQNTEGAVSVTTSKGTYQSRHVIFATPPQQVLRVNFEPPLPHQRRSLLQHTPAGSYWKFMAVYEKPFWREQGLSGAASSPDKVIATVFDISPAGAKHGILMSFVVRHKARTLSLASQDKRKEEILDCLVSFFGPKAKDVTRLIEHTMMDEEYIGGCPVSNSAPGMWTTLGP